MVKRAPDRAFVSISAESRARTSREAQQPNADAMTAVLAKLKAAGLAGDAIQTTGLRPAAGVRLRNGEQTLRDYVARNTIEVRVDELPKLGDMLDAAVGAGATSVAGVRFDLKDRSGAEREALQKAVEDARARADAAAARCGHEGRAHRADRGAAGDGHAAAAADDGDAQQAMAEAAPTPVVAGELEIRATVTLTAAIR